MASSNHFFAPERPTSVFRYSFSFVVKIKLADPMFMFILVLLSAPVSILATEGSTAKSLEISMQPHKHYFSEHCLMLEKGQRLGYQVHSAYPLDFNIHHHLNNSTEFPVKDWLDSHSSKHELTVNSSGEYCFMWKNPEQRKAAFNIQLDYQVFSK